MGRNPNKPLHFKGVLLLEEHGVFVLFAHPALILLADIKRWRASQVFSLISMLSIFQ